MIINYKNKPALVLTEWNDPLFMKGYFDLYDILCTNTKIRIYKKGHKTSGISDAQLYVEGYVKKEIVNK